MTNPEELLQRLVVLSRDACLAGYKDSLSRDLNVIINRYAAWLPEKGVEHYTRPFVEGA